MDITFSENAQIVLERRYLKKDGHGRIVETPHQLLTRVASSVASADALLDPHGDVERTTEIFVNLMASRRFLPNSPTLMNAGRRLGQLAACFVLPIEDSMESIFETLKHTAMIHKSGGGTGFSFSRIRPASDVVLSTAGISSGPLSFMNVYDVATETVKQGGTRRGANMGVLQVDHPDIEAFIQCKNDRRFLNNFNLSVGLTRAFMEALEGDASYDLINPRTGKTVRQVEASRIFHMIVDAAWNTGEPGVLFLDRINEHQPTPQLGRIEATNPCGEQPLLPYESCTLGSINLSVMVENGKINWSQLRQTVHEAVHFLDNVIDVNVYPLPCIEEMTKRTRKIGLGVMGFADMLIHLGIGYDSDAAVATAEEVMAFIQRESRLASADLARTRGNFPAYAGSIYDTPETPYMRNATTTTIAPTGTISIIAGTSSGIEPLFAVAQARHVLDGQRLYEMHPLFLEIGQQEGFLTEDLKREIAEVGSLRGINEVPSHIRQLFRTSHEISPWQHIRIQAAFQKYTDNAVSKTVNLPANATKEDVENVYRMAYASGCKGVTIYRDGSRQHQVLQLGTTEKRSGNISRHVAPRPRPERTHGVTQRVRTGCGNLYVTVNSDDQGVCEVFAQMGKTGGCASSQIEAAGRLISLALRSGVSADAIIRQLTGIRCPSPSWQNGRMVLSCPDAMAQVLKSTTDSDETGTPEMVGVCPECNGVLAHEEGCMICRSCGYSKC